MSTPELEEPLGAGRPTPDPGTVSPDGWKRDKQGRDYVTRPGIRGPLYRRGQETIQERIDRANRPADEAPKKKGGRPKKIHEQAAPDDLDLRAIEKALAEALQSPAMLAGLAGDVYLANHFTVWGPRLARNLVVAAEANPWLRRQLEQLSAGGAGAMTILTMIGLAGGIICYTAPPIIYMFNLPAPAMAREMFAIPDRRNHADTAPTVPTDSSTAPAGS